MPRRYDLGKRQDQKDATRDRIVAAAAELFRDQGAVRTSIAQIAAAADVAPGTVRNHFPTTDDLAAAVAAYVMVLLRMPGPELFDGAAEPAERVAALAHAMGAYYERSAPWYGMPDLDDAPLPAWAAARASYNAEYEALVRTALGPLGHDDSIVRVVAAMLDPSLFGSLTRRGYTTNDAADLIAELVTSWLRANAR